MAARFAYQHPDAIQGLALWAAYPASSDDLSERSLQVVSIIGSKDGWDRPGCGGDPSAATRKHAIHRYRRRQSRPIWLVWRTTGDAEATITREDQQAQALQATLELLAGLE